MIAMRRIWLVALMLVAAACTGGRQGSSPPPAVAEIPPKQIVRIQTIPVPEGPVAPEFTLNPTGNRFSRPLSEIQQYIPAPLPEPLVQPPHCFGGNLVVTFADGSKVTYGPCQRPDSINNLWAGMMYVIDPECAPRCGPGGIAGP
jgi:hypothetical protein